MIRVRRSRIAPAVLESKQISEFRSAIKKFYTSTSKERKQQEGPYISNDAVNNNILRHLQKVFHSKCAYCESPVDIKSATYDHFRPTRNARGMGKEFSRNHYWWLAFTWGNLYLSCNTCNISKSTWFPVKGKRANRSYSSIALKNEKRLLVVQNPIALIN